MEKNVIIFVKYLKYANIFLSNSIIKFINFFLFNCVIKILSYINLYDNFINNK